MKKTDLIKFRCTPAFKAQLVREATYRGITLSELCEEALAPLARQTTPSRTDIFKQGEQEANVSPVYVSSAGGAVSACGGPAPKVTLSPQGTLAPIQPRFPHGSGYTGNAAEIEARAEKHALAMIAHQAEAFFPDSEPEAPQSSCSDEDLCSECPPWQFCPARDSA